jgi:hypothetical protein
VAFVERRARVYEVGRNVAHAAMLLEPFSPAMRTILDLARRRACAELDRVFGPELGGDPTGTLRAALDIVTNPKSWDALRTHHGLSIEQAEQVMCRMARGLVHADPHGDIDTDIDAAQAVSEGA